MSTGAAPFELHGVVHLVRPWGAPVADLEHLRERIAAAPAQVLFHHAVQYPLRHPAAEELPPDDFSAWIGGVVQDAETAERLSFVVQGHNASAEELRASIAEVLGARAARRAERDVPEGGAFQFLSSTPLDFPAGVLVSEPAELVEALVGEDPCVWFFHLVEEPWFEAGRAPLLEWLRAGGHARVADWLAEAAHSGLPIDRARAKLLQRWRRSRIGQRVADATRTPDEARREAGRQAVARLVRRRTRSEEPA